MTISIARPELLPGDSMWIRRAILVFGISVAVCGLFILPALRSQPSTRLDAARQALNRRDFRNAETLASGIPFDGTAIGRDAVFLAADAAERQQRYESAVEYLERIPDSDPVVERARMRCGDLLLGVLRQPYRAERQFRRVLRANPNNADADDRLSFLLGLCASSWEAIPHRIQLLRHDRYDAVHLFLLCVGDTVLENAEQLPPLQESAPEDRRVLLGVARVLADQQNYTAARALLEQAIKVAPDLVETHVKLGQLLQEQATPEELARWEANLPRDADQHPGIWAVRGTWSMMHGQPDVAIRCFWECVLRDPNHERSNYQLSQLLLARGETAQVEPFLSRSRQLNEYFNAVKIAYVGSDDPAVLRAAKIAEGLGLNWESGAWYRLLAKKPEFAAESQAGLQRLAPHWREMPVVRADPRSNPAKAVDLARYPLPQPTVSMTTAKVVGAPSSPPMGLPIRSAGGITFDDDALNSGISFQYFNGARTGTTEHRMYEFSGGGIAVLDYDRDGLPDLYFAQGCAWPPGSGSEVYLDRLFRNGDSQFTDVTMPSQLREPGFSQGVTAGDYDNDGFPDLYVANIGRNTFFRNNGDGTFTDNTESAGTAGEDRWSTSAALADLNGDGWPDLYVVNYLSGSDVFDRICPDAGGVPRSCSPRHFPAAQDQLWLNLGDGTFREMTRDSGIEVPDGKGLGIVVGDFDGSGRPGVFIANDAVPNFYFVNQSASGALPRFEEQALISGLAVDVDGRPQACMGVAAGDANGDGQVDLFVTNFFNECNTLYRQTTPGVFEDATRSTRLYDVSLKMVGFGTQFLDADFDGRLDVMVVNGDVDDLGDIGRDYSQRPQFLWNAGDGTFHEIRDAALGRYFSGKVVGRSLVRLDWNRDGREDVAVSHLDVPVALLTNRSQTGRGVTIHLVGTQSPRDPIGATVTCRIGSVRHTRQLTAGDGYMASNQRILTFGLGTHDQVDDVEIRWPSGRRTEVSSLPANGEFVIVEGSEHPVAIHKPSKQVK